MFYRIYGLPVRQFVLYLGQDPLTMADHIDDPPNLQFKFPLIPFYTLPHEWFLRSDNPEEQMLAILGNLGQEEPVKVVEKILKNIDQQPTDVGTKNKYFNQLRITKPDTAKKQLTDTIFNLDTVQISTAYQKLSVEKLTGSYEKISNTLFNRTVGSDVLSHLENNRSILFDKRNASQPNLQIRGLATLTETISQPLIILDNFPYEGELSQINPNDVLDVSILKDAAAASIWGAKAGNGVIVITTKHAALQQSIRVEAHVNYSYQQKPDLFSLPALPTDAVITLQTDLYRLGAFDSYLDFPGVEPALTPLIELLHDRQFGLISPEDSAMRVQSLLKQDVRHDFEKYVYRNSFNQQYQAAVSVGGSQVSDRFSVGLDKNMYNLVGNDYRRLTLSNTNHLQLNPKLSLQTGLQYQYSLSHDNSLGPYGTPNYDMTNSVYPSASFALPIYARLADDQGRPLAIGRYRQSYIDTVGGGQLLDWNFRPLDEIHNNDQSAKTTGLILDADLAYQWNAGIRFDALYRYQQQNIHNRDLHNLDSYYARDLINLFTNLTASTEAAKYPVPVGGILQSVYSEMASHNLRGQFSIDRTFHDKYAFNAIAGAELRQVQRSVQGAMTYGYDQRLNVSNVDFVNYFPRLLGSASAISKGDYYSDYQDRYVSFYANASYAYRKRYTLYASGRNDASNLFGAKTRNKWRPLWSAGTAWNLSEESFYHVDLLPLLKIRVTYGYQGNINNAFSAYTRISYNSASGNAPINVPYANVSQPGNPDLRWEKVSQVNAAVDYYVEKQLATGQSGHLRQAFGRRYQHGNNGYDHGLSRGLPQLSQPEGPWG
ncbi:TonB-dependent outer membrane receptor, SusC/RagA subfamily, signature region [bacterium A37T11]|nr:TonB-dependent outer membrane receptor, SusC/RagA subfamily, signature region [bacterium A37T11]